MDAGAADVLAQWTQLVVATRMAWTRERDGADLDVG